MEAVQGSSEAGVCKIISVWIHLTRREVKQLHGKLKMNADYPFQSSQFSQHFKNAFSVLCLKLNLLLRQLLIYSKHSDLHLSSQFNLTYIAPNLKFFPDCFTIHTTVCRCSFTTKSVRRKFPIRGNPANPTRYTACRSPSSATVSTGNSPSSIYVGQRCIFFPFWTPL